MVFRDINGLLRVTAPVLTSDKGKEDNISPRALILAVIIGKLMTFTLHNPLRYSKSYPPVEMDRLLKLI